MKYVIRALFSIFFAVAIGVHIYYLYTETDKQILWHTLYFITYGSCWGILFSGAKHRASIYATMALFPFFTHVYYGYRHLPAMDAMFWVCVLVCVLLPLGFLWLKKEMA